MTEKEWLECNDSLKILDFIRRNTSERKLRLFAAACYRRVWRVLKESERTKVTATENYADGEITREQWDETMRYDDGSWTWRITPLENKNSCMAANNSACVTKYFQGYSRRAASMLTTSPSAEGDEVFELDSLQMQTIQSNLVRDIFGNPFRPVTIDPSWLTPTVTALALTIYDNRRFADMPILADALEEAGCTNEDILQHCRSGGEHVRGCWVVDLLLATE